MTNCSDTATVALMSADEALERYRRAMIRQEHAEADVRAASDERAVAVVEALDDGATNRELAAALGISHARVAQLAARGRAVIAERQNAQERRP